MEVMGCTTIEELVTLWQSYSTPDFVANYKNKREFLHNLSEFFFKCEQLPKTNGGNRFEDMDNFTTLEQFKTAAEVQQHVQQNITYIGDHGCNLDTLVKLYIKDHIACQPYNGNFVMIRDTATKKSWLMEKGEFRLLTLLM